MAIGPDEMEELSQLQLNRAGFMEKFVDDYLSDAEVGRNLYSIKIAEKSRKILNELVDRYESAGWSSVSWVPDEDDPNYVYLMLRRNYREC